MSFSTISINSPRILAAAPTGGNGRNFEAEINRIMQIHDPFQLAAELLNCDHLLLARLAENPQQINELKKRLSYLDEYSDWQARAA